jgi:hypothetical protein
LERKVDHLFYQHCVTGKKIHLHSEYGYNSHLGSTSHLSFVSLDEESHSNSCERDRSKCFPPRAMPKFHYHGNEVTEFKYRLQETAVSTRLTERNEQRASLPPPQLLIAHRAVTTRGTEKGSSNKAKTNKV